MSYDLAMFSSYGKYLGFYIMYLEINWIKSSDWNWRDKNGDYDDDLRWRWQRQLMATYVMP